jgi:hypothetical protein
MNLYEIFVPTLTTSLNALKNVLQKAEDHCASNKIDPAVLLAARLYPDMLPLARQVQIACDHGRRGANRLTGTEPASVPDTEASFAELRARVDSTLAILAALKPEDLAGSETRVINFKAGPVEMSMTGNDFLRFWTIPNFYFHYTTAYDILRHNGVAIGKTDFLRG